MREATAGLQPAEQDGKHAERAMYVVPDRSAWGGTNGSGGLDKVDEGTQCALAKVERNEDGTAFLSRSVSMAITGAGET